MDAGRFSCHRCTRLLCCSVESAFQAGGGMGSQEESGGLVAVMLKYSFPPSQDVSGGWNGRAAAATGV